MAQAMHRGRGGWPGGRSKGVVLVPAAGSATVRGAAPVHSASSR
jgi:hypothetical protein